MERLNHVPREFMPSYSTQHYKVLAVLVDGQPHKYKEFLDVLERDPRSPLQILRGPDGGFWMIHNLSRGVEAIYQLDQRHLEGCPYQDQLARMERHKQYLTDSKERAEMEASRLPEARQRLDEIRFNESQHNLPLGELEAPEGKP